MVDSPNRVLGPAQLTPVPAASGGVRKHRNRCTDSTGTGVRKPPAPSRLTGTHQLLAVCAAFAITGLGETMMMGAEEAWVVDNFKSSGRSDLVEPFFARTYAVDSIGGVIAGSVALTLLLVLPVDRGLLDALWYVAACGFLVSVGVAIAIPEVRPAPDPNGTPSVLSRVTTVATTIWRIKPVFFLTLALFIANLSGSGADEAFPVALIGTGIDARALAPVSIAEDLFGVGAPLLALALAHRFGVERLLSQSLLFCGAAVTVLFAWRSAVVIIALWIVLGFVDRMWDPVAMARLQEDIPSEHRAAIGSFAYQASGVAEFTGLGLLAVLFGTHGAGLHNATPDLVEAFSHRTSANGSIPVGLFGLPIPDMAILILVVVAVFAVPFVFLAGRARVASLPSGAGAGKKGPAS